jgi:hypothetical protein
VKNAAFDGSTSSAESDNIHIDCAKECRADPNTLRIESGETTLIARIDGSSRRVKQDIRDIGDTYQICEYGRGIISRGRIVDGERSLAYD